MAAYIKVSVIIPVYNAEKYLEQCLDSVLAQTIQDKEIICINDGSTDLSEDLLKAYNKKYDFICYYNQENQGAGAARNYGLKMAKGEFVAYLDADDFYLDLDALEKMYTICIKNCIEVCGSFLSKSVNGKVISLPLHRNLFKKDKQDKALMQYEKYQYDYYYISYIYSRKMLIDHNIKFPLYRRYQDPPFFVKAMIVAEKFCVVPIE